MIARSLVRHRMAQVRFMKLASSMALSICGPAVHAQTSAADMSDAASPAASESEKAQDKAPGSNTALPAISSASDEHGLDRFERLGIKGWDTPFPRVTDSMFQDIGGVRSALADAGIGVLGVSLNAGAYNFRNDDTPGATYNGKHPTYFAGLQALYLTYDTGKIGIPDGQIQVIGYTTANGLNRVNGPRFARIGGLAYFQQLWDDKVEFKIGYFTMSPEFIGSQVAGSLVAGTLGPQASIPVQLGFAYPGTATPAAAIRINGQRGWYAKFGVQRSFPRGGINQVINDDKIGLRFSFPGAKPLFVGEFGINRKAQTNSKSLWVRGGAIYNTTQYVNYQTSGTTQNWALFIGADRQLTQVDPKLPFRGVYIGASFNYAPPELNRYTRYHEARIYGIGLLKGRPSDLTSLVISYNKLSGQVLEAQYSNQDVAKYAASAIASYSYRLVRGLYFQPGVGLVKNPTPAPRVPLAVNGYLTISFLL